MFLKSLLSQKNDTVIKDVTLQEALDKMSLEGLHHIIIVEDSKPIGILSESDIVKLYNDNIDFNKPIGNYGIKPLITLHSSRMVNHALSIMIDNDIRRIIVVNRQNEYLGTIEQEEIVFTFESKLDRNTTKIINLLSNDTKALIVNHKLLLKELLSLMSKGHLTSVLVEKNNIPYGIISESDILKLAQTHTNKNKEICNFTRDSLKVVDNTIAVYEAIKIMKENKFRRIVVQDKESKEYYILTSKSLLTSLKGSYTSFLESKLFDARDTFNALSEYIIEVLDTGDDQVIFWANKITKTNFNVNIDDHIEKVIPKETWLDILEQLKNEKTLHTIINFNKSHFQLKAHCGTMLDDRVIKIFLNDITEIVELNLQLQEQNKIQEELIYNQIKMVQMGEMIGNIAHQWRQPLSIISTSSSGLQLKKQHELLNDNEFFELTDNITNNAVHLSDTIEVFRNFIREKKELQYLVLQERLDIALSIVSPALKNRHITINNTINYQNPLTLQMILGELDQVIINILNNAKDALLEKEIENPTIKIFCDKVDQEAVISIEDNAGGIPKDIKENIFTKYFTTKEEAIGTGLGLYMSHKIITESLNGKIEVLNTTQGAKFIIKLPLN